ncbi:MAG: hypothetical protein ACE5G2_06195 [Candidatus Krumholzibacteriia bacterium]
MSHAPHDAPASAIPAPARRGAIPSGRVCVAIERANLIVRHLTLPSQDAHELRQIASHQLTQILPVDLEELCWTCSIVAKREDGYSDVLVHVLRRSSLAAILQPLRHAGLEVECAIPQGYPLAQLLAEHREPGEEESSGLFVIRGALHLVAERQGALLFHRAFPGEGRPCPMLTPANLDSRLHVLRAAIEASRSEIAASLRRGLPEPLRVFCSATGDDRDAQQATTLAARLARLLKTRIVVARMERGVAGDEPPARAFGRSFAGSLARLGRDAPSLLPPDELRGIERKKQNQALKQLALLVCGLLFATALYTTGDLLRAQERLALLDARVEEERPGIEELARMRRALVAAGPRRDAVVEPVQVLGSIQAAASGGDILIESLAYSRGGTVALRGTSPNVAAAVRLAETLRRDPLWSEVRIPKVQAYGDGRSARAFFELKGELVETNAAVADQGTPGRRPGKDVSIAGRR